MPSPFPGMDPYLEDPGVWPGFHNTFADRICTVLNQDLPQPYYAQIEIRTETGVPGEGTHRVIVPDVGVQRMGGGTPNTPASEAGGLAVATRPRTAISPSVRIAVSIEPTEVASISIRDSSRGRELVTLIEIASPANKRPGPDRDRYLAKLDETLASQTSLVEIDLLRSGTRAWNPPRCAAGLFVFNPPADYLVVVNRAWQRGERGEFQAFPIEISQSLPVISVPLHQNEAEPPLDLQHCFLLAYDGGPYRRGAVDYDNPPPIALPDHLEPWRKSCIEAWRNPSVATAPKTSNPQSLASS